MNRVISIGFVTYGLTFIFEAALRYGLHLVGLEPLLYGREFLLPAMTLYALAFNTRAENVYLPLLVGCLLALHLLVSLLYIPDARQILFGLKLIVPFLFGMFALKVADEGYRRAVPGMSCVYALTAGAIITNYFYAFPWEGLVYYVDGVRVTANVLWWAGEERRIAGLTRASYDAAVYCLISALYVTVFSRAAWVRILVWSSAGLAIAITTAKGVVLAYGIISVILWFRNAALGSAALSRLIWLPVTTMILAPIGSGLFAFKVDSTSPIERLLFMSYMDRIENTWPQAFELVANYGDFLLGRGIGGIGTPQMFSEAVIWNWADNLFVYAYANFGLLALVYLLLFAHQAQRLDLKTDVDAFVFGCAMLVAVYGMTASIMEGAVLAVVFGFTAGHLIDLQRLRSLKIRAHIATVRGWVSNTG